MIQSFDRRSAGRVTDRQDERSASIPDCAQWAREYFDQYPNTNVEVSVLYQARLAGRRRVSSALQHQFAGRKDRDEPDATHHDEWSDDDADAGRLHVSAKTKLD